MSIDVSIGTALSIWVVALVSAIRKLDPRVDGLIVLGVAAVCSAVSAFAYFGADWRASLRYAAVAWIGAVGGVQFLYRTLAKGAIR